MYAGESSIGKSERRSTVFIGQKYRFGVPAA
jgi:hypothetical protein